MDSLTFGLKPSVHALKIGAQIYASTDRDFIKTGLSRIVQTISNYDDFCLAGRLLLNEIVRSVQSIEMYLTFNGDFLNEDVRSYIEAHADIFNQKIREAERLNYDNQDFFSADTLCKKYLFRSIASKSPTETPVMKNLRLAVQFYYDVSLEKVLQAFDEMNESYYTHATPTLCNAGTKIPQMASCFLMNVADSLDSMMYTGVGDMAMISRYSGGIGVGLNRVRHSDIGGTGDSAGVIPCAKVYDGSVGYVDQSRNRRGAATGFLNSWHIDTFDFIRAASNFAPADQKLTNLHTCEWAHDLLFERAISDEDWTLFCPNTVLSLDGKYGAEFERLYTDYEKRAPFTETEYQNANSEYDRIRSEFTQFKNATPEQRERFIAAGKELKRARKARIVYKTIPARSVLVAIGKAQLQGGKPYVMNGDRSNMKSNQKNIGPINNSNLCVEIVQYSSPDTFSSCNLASINLPRFARGRYVSPNGVRDDVGPEVSDEAIMKALAKAYDFVRLGQIIHSVVRNIDKVIDHNFYPFDENKIKNFNMETRPLGIGVSGLDDTFKELDLIYGSRESRLLNKMIFACMYFNALMQSNLLAIELGEYVRFRTGGFTQYDPVSGTQKSYIGSPLANGFLQFDLWSIENDYDVSLGRVHEQSDYDPADNIPVSPHFFGHEGMTWHDLRTRIMETGTRNSLLIALMPTATTAQVLRNAESVEAHQSNIYSRQVGGGSYTIINRRLYSDLDEIGLLNEDVANYIYNKDGNVTGLTDFVVLKTPETPENIVDRLRFIEKKYQTMFDIKPSVYLSMARQRGIYVDQSQSTNIYMFDPTITQLAGVQMCAYYNKLKTHIYYMRNKVATANTGFNKKVADLKLFGSHQQEVAPIVAAEEIIIPAEPEVPVVQPLLELEVQNLQACPLKEGPVLEDMEECLMCGS